MAKPSAGFHTPRPTSLRSAPALASATRSSAGSSSSSAAAAAKLPVAATAVPRDLAPSAKVVAKCLQYDDDLTLPAATALSLDTLPEGLAAQEDHFAPLLALPDPEASGDASSTSTVSAPSDDAVTASTDSCVTEVAVHADSTADTDAPLPEQISLVLAELHAAAGLSPRSKRLLSALAEAATTELAPTAAARRLRRAAFWGKVRVAVLATTVATVAAVDIALAAYLYARRVSDRHHVLPPT